MATAGELREILRNANAGWSVDARLSDNDPIPKHATGGDLSQAEKVDALPRADISTLLAAPTSNPYLLGRRVGRSFLDAKTLSADLAGRMESTASAGVTRPSSIDWRSRFGQAWLTEVKDQDPCGSCWCFSGTGVVEAMTRIEHVVWSLRSEGDVHDGMGYKCAQGGWPNHALSWIQSNGVADAGCWAYETTDEPYRPSSDRSGRTVRLKGFATLTTVEDQKDWLDTNGPLSACFTCYDDFHAYGPDQHGNFGVYTHHDNSQPDGHCIIIVGYDDTRQAWLVRNSWSAGWGMGGYCWFGYGQCDIDNNAKYGVATNAINPDPWTKRRMHAGGLFESGDGALSRNFELWAVAPAGGVRHYWRDGSSLAWAVAETEGQDCADHPVMTGTTYNRNFEYIYKTNSNRLHHRFFDQVGGKWNDGGVFGPPNVGGVPGFIQSDYGAPGNFEVVVRLSDGTLQHCWRINGPPWTWAVSVTFGSNVAFSGPTLIQRRDRGLDVVCVNTDGQMQRYWRDDAHGGQWKAAETFGADLGSVPVMIEGQYAASDETKQGNYELCIATRTGAVQHWWRDNEASQTWRMSATFGSNVKQVVGLIESSFGFDLEVVLQLNDGALQHYWRQDGTWRAGPVFGSVVR